MNKTLVAILAVVLVAVVLAVSVVASAAPMPASDAKAEAAQSPPAVPPVDARPESKQPDPPRVRVAAATTVAAAPTLSARRRFTLALGGVGLIALGIGTWAGFDAASKRDDAHAHGCNADLSMCPAAALPTAQLAYSRGNLATGFVIGGIVLAGAGLALWITEPRAGVHIAPAVAPDRAGVVIEGGF